MIKSVQSKVTFGNNFESLGIWFSQEKNKDSRLQLKFNVISSIIKEK